jgi:hypothetical protein
MNPEKPLQKDNARMSHLRTDFGLPSRADAMRQFMLVFCCCVLLVGCQPPEEEISLIVGSRKPIAVNVFEPTLVNGVSVSFNYFGYLVANRRQSLGFSVPGKLTVIAEQQQRLRAGSVIAEIEHEDLKAQRESISSEIASTTQVREKARLERQLNELENRIQQSVLLAPFDCVVESVSASVNSIVRPAAPLAVVVETTTPKIEMSFPRDIARLLVADEEYDFLLGDTNIRGRLLQMSFTENPPGSVAASFGITSDLSEVNFLLGQSVEAAFLIETDDSGFWVPLSSLQQDGSGLWSVFAVENKSSGENTVVKSVVEILRLEDKRAFVKGELSGRQVVLDGLHRIVRGQQVIPNVVGTDALPVSGSE